MSNQGWKCTFLFSILQLSVPPEFDRPHKGSYFALCLTRNGFLEMYSIVIHTFWRRRVICFFPRCNPTFNSFIFPCRESWKQLGEACLESSNDRDNVSVAVLSFKAKETVAAYDYEYLPSRFGPIQCYYENVVCESPPNVTGTEIA